MTVVLVLTMLILGLSVTRGVIAFLGYHNLIGLSPFATQLLVTLAIAATTDYAIFLIGRYQEARTVGEDRESAYYTMFRGTAHVVLASGMTIAGATFCLHLHPAALVPDTGRPAGGGDGCGGTGCPDARPGHHHRRQPIRNVGTQAGHADSVLATAGRHGRPLAGPVLLLTIAFALIGLIMLPGYQPNYNDRKYLPASLPANEGFAAAERHFPIARMNPEILLVESDQDLRNSADFLVIERIAKAMSKVPGIGTRAGDHPS